MQHHITARAICFLPSYKLASPSVAHSLQKHKLNFSMGLCSRLSQSKKLEKSTLSRWTRRAFSTFPEDPELKPFLNYLDNLKNYEKIGVPKNAGTNSSQGFDLGPMSRLMHLLGNPQSNFKTVHIAGTKGKGSTAAFLSNILRSEGYSVGCYTSPHIRTIRERMSLGRLGEPVSAKSLNCVFNKNRNIIDEALELENGRLSHFEVLTAMAFSLFAEENVDIAVIEAGLGGARDATNIISSSELALSVITTIGEEHLAALGGSLESIAIAKSGIIKHGRPLVLGGPFQQHIECILRDQASLMRAPVVLASDDANRCVVKQISKVNGKPCQSCDIVLQIEKDIPLSIELRDVNLCIPGIHQLQNAATATCAALCLRDQGWRISDLSVRSGLECTYMPGRSQFLTSTEVEALGLSGATVLLDGAHTKDSARALVDMIQMTCPDAPLVLMVAMATDKDHLSFAREFLSGRQLEAVLCTEVDIGGGKSRTTAASVLRDHWVLASKELGLPVHPDVWSETENRSDNKSDHLTVVTAESSLWKSMKNANDILSARGMNHSGIIVVTGSLHIVSSVLASLHGWSFPRQETKRC